MNRETWLQAATAKLSERFVACGLPPVPADVKISCGFPGGGSPRKRIGECWPRSRSKAGVNEVFINPTLSDRTQVLAVLAHELCHAIDDCKSGHKAAFARLARGVGLEGAMTATIPGAEFTAWCASVDLPDFPHESLIMKGGRSDRSGARVKLTCQEHGFSWWVSKAGFQELQACPFCEGTCHTGEESDDE